MSVNPCPQCGQSRETIESACEHCDWAPQSARGPAPAPQRKPSRTIINLLLTFFALALWGMLFIHLYGIAKITLVFGIHSIVFAVLSGLTWGAVMGSGAILLYALYHWRKEKDRLNAFFFHFTVGCALAPLVFALGFYIPAKLDAKANQSQDAEIEIEPGPIAN